MHIKRTLSFGLCFISMRLFEAVPDEPIRPNIILVMADDLGWGDVSFNGGTIPTPHLDQLAGAGIQFNRFYSAGSVCSPTRASCLTGRNPLRLNIPDANVGRIERDETLLSEVLHVEGYRTGHFGKWHLGTMTTLFRESNRGANGNWADYSPPWQHRYDYVFATEAKVPTYHPMRKTVNNSPLPVSFGDTNFYNTSYWMVPTNPVSEWMTAPQGTRVPVTDNMAGDDSRVMMDRVIPFIESAVSSNQPFFAVVWFHTPHLPLVDSNEVAAVDSNQALVSSVIGMDIEMGRLRDELAALGVLSNTMIWFCSDNGPENGIGSAGPFRARKRSLYEGGVRVPAFLHWPAMVPTGRTSDFPAVTSDYYPTILDYLGVTVDGQKPLDGISLRGVIETNQTVRTKPIGFEYNNRRSWVNHQYKLVNDNINTMPYELYDLLADPYEKTNRVSALPGVRDAMLAELTAWREEVAADAATPPNPNPDTDGDGIPDIYETGTGIYRGPHDTGTNPFKADTDGDGWDDGMEILAGTDPNNPDFFPLASNLGEARIPMQYYVVVGRDGTASDPQTATAQLALTAISTNDLFIRQRPESSNPERRARLFIKFDLADFVGLSIIGARLELHQFDRINSTTNTSSIQISRVLHGWDLSGTNFPPYTAAVDSPRIIGSTGQFGLPQSSSGVYTGQVVDIVRTWMQGPSTNHGFRIALTEEVLTGAGFSKTDDPGTPGQDESPALVLTHYVRDMDEDGVSDAWEMYHFNEVVFIPPDRDSDGDGVTDVLEEAAGTNPNDAGSYFGVRSILPEAGGIRFAFSSEVTRQYTLLGSTNLMGSWIEIQSGIQPNPPLNELVVPATNPLLFLHMQANPF